MAPAIVVDASIVVELVLMRGRAETIAKRVRGLVLHAPHLIDVETAHVVRRRWLEKDFDSARAQNALSTIVQMPIIRHSHRPLIGRMFALRENLTAYDAAYVVLAELLDIPLLTLDARLARSSGHTATIELIE